LGEIKGGKMTATIESQIQAAEQEWLDSWKLGPTRLRWSMLPLQVGDPTPDLDLIDSTGKKVRLSRFWSQQPVVLIFWRHFGCSCGIQRARRLQTEYPDYLEAGAEAIVIGPGEPERSAAYARQFDLKCAVLCDPSYTIYRAFDLLEGKPSQVFYGESEELLGGDYEAGVKFSQACHSAGRPAVDSPWQLPGEFVVDRQGVVRLAYRYQYCEDFPNPLMLLAAIREAVQSR
jgi:peroxiredoxin